MSDHELAEALDDFAYRQEMADDEHGAYLLRMAASRLRILSAESED